MTYLATPSTILKQQDLPCNLIPDLHAADYPGNIETEHEKMYAEQGI